MGMYSTVLFEDQCNDCHAIYENECQIKVGRADDGLPRLRVGEKFSVPVLRGWHRGSARERCGECALAHARDGHGYATWYVKIGKRGKVKKLSSVKPEGYEE